MAFKQARKQLLQCLEDGNFAHVPRPDAYEKNWLQVERISVERVRKMLLRCTGKQHRESPHDWDPNTTVHEFFPVQDGIRWYVKAYFDAELGEAVIMAMFISVHPSGD